MQRKELHLLLQKVNKTILLLLLHLQQPKEKPNSEIELDHHKKIVQQQLEMNLLMVLMYIITLKTWILRNS
jgi:hypothetical protein